MIRVPRKVLCWVLEKKGSHAKYIDTIKDMYEEAISGVTVIGDSKEFSIPWIYTRGQH